MNVKLFYAKIKMIKIKKGGSMLKIAYKEKDEFFWGLQQLEKYIDLLIVTNGIALRAEQTEGNMQINKDGNQVTLRYRKKHEFWFLLLRLYTHKEQEVYQESFSSPIERLGAMLDCSRNAVLTKESVKRYIIYLALMGYNYLELYTEDTYEIEGEEYFGYMRGRYSGAEIKEIDTFAKMFGIELVPCIQTLAHLNCIFKWQNYRKIQDVDDILLLRDERTYQFIDKMLQTVSKNFSSRRINLGMDEPMLLGSGAFLNKNGYVSKEELMLEHLDKVIEMAESRGFEVSIWNDTFFRVGNGNDYRVKDPYFSPELLKRIPKNAKLIYWDYIDEDEAVYENAFRNSLKLTRNTGFAAGIYSWQTFVADNDLGLRKLKPGIDACIKCGIDDVLVTSWGDDGAEASRFSILPTLCAYAEYIYTRQLTHCDKICKVLFNYTFREFCDIGIVNRYLDLDTITHTNVFYGNCAKYMLYNDLLYGINDNNVPIDAKERSMKNYRELLELSKRRSPLSYLFKTMSLLAWVLVEKCDLSIDIKQAYDTKNIVELSRLIKRICEVQKRVRAFIKQYEAQWMTENKPFGFEIQHIRLGGLMERLKYAEQCLRNYVDGKIPEIRELEEKRLPSDYNSDDYRYNPFVVSWADTVTCGRLTK